MATSRKNLFAPLQKSIVAQRDGSEKRRKLNLKLHKHHAVPFSFLEEALSNPTFPFSDTAGGTFGVEQEGYVRQCYLDLAERIASEVQAIVNQHGEAHARLVEIRGSSGVGKSAFMAYLMAFLRTHGMQNVAIFHATKTAKQASDGMDSHAISGSLWIDGKFQVTNKPFNEIRPHLVQNMTKLETIFMDGCSMTFSLEDFNGIVIVAASPSLYTRNLRQTLLRNVVLYMPPWSENEGRQLAKILDVEEDIVMGNAVFMNGIVRYLLNNGLAKKAVLDAVRLVNARSLVDMLSTQMTDKSQESIAVHALVRWNTKRDAEGRFLYDGDPSFEMVSRFAEKQVAEKLATLEVQELQSSWRKLPPLSGAEGYAGALFEAYAVRRFLSGGTFSFLSLKNRQTRSISVPRLAEPVVVECNTLSPTTVPLDEVWKKTADAKGWQPTILWPTTTNFPTFDAFYFHSDGQVYALQMTTSRKHSLKNGGAHQAANYFSAVRSATPPYCALFVVPQNLVADFTEQEFTGDVMNRKTLVLPKDEATKQMHAVFEQCVMGV